MAQVRKPKALAPDRITLLVITDEQDSSTRRSPQVIKDRTSKHFARFMQMLKEPVCDNTVIVKNVGDSLMIRVDIEITAEKVVAIVRLILDAQDDLHSDESTGMPIDIRVLVAFCVSAVNGNSITGPLNSELEKLGVKVNDIRQKLPGGRLATWLNQDLFGTPVARAFRSSGIPKGRELIIEDSVAKLMDSKLGDDGGSISDLQIGPKVAFSPIRGLEDLFDIRRAEVHHGNLRAIAKDHLKEHVWLRSVQRYDPIQQTTRQEDTLTYRQQQIRVLTEMVIPDNSIDHWHQALSHIEHGANYLRYIGHRRHGGSWTKLDGNSGREREKIRLADLVVLGAYPEFDTYFNIREAISELKLSGAALEGKQLLFARTTIFWSPRDRKDPPIWQAASKKRRLVCCYSRTSFRWAA
jgi:hypothetical protein